MQSVYHDIKSVLSAQFNEVIAIVWIDRRLTQNVSAQIIPYFKRIK